MSMARKLGIALESLPELAIRYWPGPVGRRLRYQYFKRKLRHLGRGVVFDAGIEIRGAEWVSVEDNTWIDSYVLILAGPAGTPGSQIRRRSNPAFAGAEGEVRIGRNCHIAPHTVLSGHGGLSIGDNVTVAAGSCIYSFSHHYRDPERPDDRTVYKFSSMAPPSEQLLISSPVVLESATAVGLNSVVLPGSTLGRNSWLAAGSVLRGVIPENTIAGGNPAQAFKQRFTEDV